MTNNQNDAGHEPFHRRMLEAYAAAIENRTEPPITAESALGVHRLIDALLRSAAERRITTIGD